ncbi:MAG: hypothetical protein HY900_22580 [Deltaproteobacteria bacterium]|nr:hypothetical protein [Deltaproteobacteria bacterium]
MQCFSSSLPSFPIRWPKEYRRLAETLEAPNPLFALGAADPSEEGPDAEALGDPTGERRLRPLPFLLRKHPDRALVLASRRCFLYCRFCFRRGELTGAAQPGPRDWQRIGRWLSEHPEVEELIVSGGDPLTLPDARLRQIALLVGSLPGLARWRIHTRAPAVFPERVSSSLLETLRTPQPLRVVVHAAHPAELRPAFWGAVGRLRDAGCEVLDQTVLLSGVNASPEILGELFARLAAEGVRPHYLHHPDRAQGNRRFRVTIEEGLRLYRSLLERSPAVTQGGATPPYVLDLPNGAGKARVEDLRPVAEERGTAGRRVRYRWTRPPGWTSVVPESYYEWWDVRESNSEL